MFRVTRLCGGLFPRVEPVVIVSAAVAVAAAVAVVGYGVRSSGGGRV